jgi:hypothetical protein
LKNAEAKLQLCRIERCDPGEELSPRATLPGEFTDATPHPALRATFSHRKSGLPDLRN